MDTAFHHNASAPAPPWGTWEELLLGGAVLRHGRHDWKVVAAELRARTTPPFNVILTPEICKEKYEELKHRYSGRKIWYEELRKKRILELKQALSESDDSIGSLESKLEILTAERKNHSQDSYDSSRTESAAPCQKYDAVEFTSKDGLSAGSFTQETTTNWEIRTSPSPEELEPKPEPSVSNREDDATVKINDPLDVLRGFSKGRRGTRKRKSAIVDPKEGSVGENSASSCSNSEIDALMRIFNDIAEQKCASVFRRRLDSQKRGRYKKMIMRHLDFDTIRSNIANGCIKSAKELFRDLLLLANNALVFYSKTTREYKSALLLREIVSNSLKMQLKDYITKKTIEILSSSLSVSRPPTADKPVKGGGHVKAASKTSKGDKRIRVEHPNGVGSPPAAKKDARPGRRGGRGRAARRPDKIPKQGKNRTKVRHAL